MMKNIILPVVGISLGLGICHSAMATMTLYSNGPISGTQTAWNISNPKFMTDSFTIGGQWHVTSVDFGAWTSPGDTISQVDWMITPFDGFGIPYGSGTASVSATPFGTSTGSIPGSGYTVDQYSFSTGTINLSPGTYYLTLFNATTNTPGNFAYWDQNSGPSAAYQNILNPEPSESFDILGTVPEPSGYVPLALGAVCIGLLAYRRRLASV